MSTTEEREAAADAAFSLQRIQTPYIREILLSVSPVVAQALEAFYKLGYHRGACEAAETIMDAMDAKAGS